MARHPIERQAANLPPDIREMATRQAADWDVLVQRIESLVPGDPTAEALLREASVLLQSLTINYGPIHGWTLAQHHVIYRHANRAFGAGQLIISAPEWTERL